MALESFRDPFKCTKITQNPKKESKRNWVNVDTICVRWTRCMRMEISLKIETTQITTEEEEIVEIGNEKIQSIAIERNGN